jgi:nucleoside triphosphate pyrophosphatase
MAARLVLASASPRRRELLAQLGVPFEVVTSDVPETPAPAESPAAFAQRVARDKAAEVARRCPEALVLAADTVVAVEGAIFGKPRDRADARRMLEALSGRTHVVLTAVALRTPAGDVEELVVRSAVEFRALTAREIENYLDGSEPFDKAGAYAVQGEAQRFVVQVRGSYTNVVGLPVDQVRELLRRHLPHGAAIPAVP